MSVSPQKTGWLVLFALSAAWWTSCAVGPDYKCPAVPSSATFRGDTVITNISFADLAWWKVYSDAELQALVREAFTNNYDLRIAAARVEQSRQAAAQSRSQFVPSVDYSGTVAHGRNDLFGSAYPDNAATASSSVATLNAFWEVDLWGRVRRLNEAARANFLASEEARRGVRLSLLSDVATAYLQLLELDQEVEITSRTTNSFAESLKIFSQRAEGGTASALETSRAEAALANAAAATPSLLSQITLTENRLSILLGRNPGPIERTSSSLETMLPPEVPAGLPASLLERRPDVRGAEQNLRAANALIGESVAEFFPKIGLTALLGKISPELSAFTLGGANAWGVAAEGTGPIFEGGRRLARYREAKAARDEARLRFQQIAQSALADVSDALVLRQRLGEIVQQQMREVSALETAVRVSSERYRAGKASYYEVLEAQQQLFPAQINLARTQRDQQLAVVSLYKALGGGWNDGTLKH
jgi:multidrug efflux system outer membrane protein